jgi:hypothetical protein
LLNLNLIEHLWRFGKKVCLDARYLTPYDDFTTTIDTCLRALHTSHCHAMNTLIPLQFQTVEDKSIVAT